MGSRLFKTLRVFLAILSAIGLGGSPITVGSILGFHGLFEQYKIGNELTLTKYACYAQSSVLGIIILFGPIFPLIALISLGLFIHSYLEKEKLSFFNIFCISSGIVAITVYLLSEFVLRNSGCPNY